MSRQKKQSECSAFIRVPQASEVGLSFSSSDAIPPSSVGNKALSMPALCHAFYLSTLLPASLSLPSAVGHSSVAASNLIKEHRNKAVNIFFVNIYIFFICGRSLERSRPRWHMIGRWHQREDAAFFARKGAFFSIIQEVFSLSSQGAFFAK